MEGGRVGEVLGVWRLDRLIGSGGMGDVYHAQRIDGVVEQSAAVKILRALRDRASPDEATLLRLLIHTNIARHLADGWTADGHRYLVLEYVDGLPITAYADQNGLSVHERLELFLEVCGAVEYAHHHLLVHMDLKPSNILVDRCGSVKVIDFGISRRVEAQPMTLPCDPFSGPYSSPEQIQPGSKLGYPTDIYSLGAILYELLSGHEPFNPSVSVAELERQIIEQNPSRPSHVIGQPKLKAGSDGKYFRLDPEAIASMRGNCRVSEARRLLAGDLDCVCLFALRKEAVRRYQSVEDLQFDLQRILAGRSPAIARSGDAVHSVLRAARRKPVAPLAVITALVVTIAGLLTFNVFSTGIQVSLENKRHSDQAMEATLLEMKEQLWPQLGSDPSWGSSRAAVEAVMKTSTPAPLLTLSEQFRVVFSFSAPKVDNGSK